MIEDEGLEVLASVVAPIISLMRRTGYFDLRAEASRLGPNYFVTLATFEKPARRLLAKKNARFWPLLIDELPHESARKYFRAHGMNRLVGQMTDSDMRFIKKFVLQNWPIEAKEAARKLKNSYICSPARIKRIIRTERIIALNGSKLENELGKGRYKYKIWCCVSDGASRKSHKKRDGEKRLLNEPFSGGIMFPGDGPASECVNCRCILLYSNS